MSTRNWTPAQRAAIEDEGGALLVSAAAGSGKTAVLVERAVRLITRENDPVPADRLLIVTFTNAAAEELRARIASRLELALREAGGSAQLRRQRMLLKRAFIGTIDSYCIALVREHFAALDLPPDVNIGDAALLEALAGDAMADTMEEMYESDDFAAFVALYGRARSDREAERAVRALYDFTRTLPHPAKQLERLAAMYNGEEKLADTIWGRELLQYAQNALAAALRLAEAAYDVALKDELLVSYDGPLSEDVAAIMNLRRKVKAGEWDAAFDEVEQHAFSRMPAIRNYEGTAKDRVNSLRKSVKKIFDDLGKYCFVCSSAEFEDDRAVARPLISALCRAAALFEEKFLARKLEERVLDFSDFEHLALRLLQTGDGARTPVAERVSAGYDVVMVDEYQDTNELQSALYESLGCADGGNLFYVGDVKQSIYRFRKANPGIFLAKKAAWAPHGKGAHPAVITLGHNFRSGNGVINGANFVFSTLMSPQLGDIEYNGEERLIQGTPGGDERGFGLFLTEDPEGGPDCLAVARRVKRMVEEGYPVREGEGTRPCRYDDFCILLRARGRMLDYAAAFEAEGVPVVVDTSEDLLQTPEILPLCAALAAIDNPGDDINLTATLLGPLFGFTPDELAALRAESPRGGMWGALLASEDEKVKAFLEDIRHLRARAVMLPVGRLCEELIERTGYLAAVSAMEGGAARRENLYRFIGWAGECSASGRGTLAGFVRLIAAGKGPAGPPAKALPGHVMVLTIHKSKGLEFPICILADAARSFNRMDLNSRVQMHAELGIGLHLRAGDILYPTLMQLAIRSRLAGETISEEMRVLYVALTRAKDNMLVAFSCKDAEKTVTARAEELAGSGPDPFLLARAGSFADWLLTAALCHPEAGPLLQYAGGIIPEPLEGAEGHFVMEVAPAEAVEAAEAGEYQLTAAPDEPAAQRLAEGFRFTAPRQALQALPRKVSVSALTKTQEGTHIAKRPSFMYKTGLTAAERGSAQHAFMQFADFAAAQSDLEGEIARLAAEGFLPAAWAENIDRATAAAFFASPLFARLQAAEQVHRELDFFTTIPAGRLNPDLPAALAGEQVLVQGIADLVLVQNGAVEIVDYKTDRIKQAAAFVEKYTGQLALYAQALAGLLAQPVAKLTIWSFALGREIDVPLPPQTP